MPPERKRTNLNQLSCVVRSCNFRFWKLVKGLVEMHSDNLEFCQTKSQTTMTAIQRTLDREKCLERSNSYLHKLEEIVFQTKKTINSILMVAKFSSNYL